MDSVFRHLELIEWVFWLGGAALLLSLGLLYSRYRRGQSRRNAGRVESRERWRRIIDPLAGGPSVWGSWRPSIGVRLGLLYVGMFLVYAVKSPLPGALVILWALVLHFAVWLEKRRRKEARPETR